MGFRTRRRGTPGTNIDPRRELEQLCGAASHRGDSQQGRPEGYGRVPIYQHPPAPQQCMPEPDEDELKGAVRPPELRAQAPGQKARQVWAPEPSGQLWLGGGQRPSALVLLWGHVLVLNRFREAIRTQLSAETTGNLSPCLMRPGQSELDQADPILTGLARPRSLALPARVGTHVSSSFFMSLERNFSLKLVRVTSPGYFRSSKFSSNTSWSSASEEAKEWAAGSDCKKPAGRGFNRWRAGRPTRGCGDGPFGTVHRGRFAVSCFPTRGDLAPSRHRRQHPEGYSAPHLSQGCPRNVGATST